MGGTLCFDTGAELLITALRQLRRAAPPWAEKLCFEITGKGPSLEGLTALAAESGAPKVLVHGRTTDLQYREVLRRSDVGLALKPNTGALASTTFPSKVIEFAAEGLLVLTTDISDVHQVLGSGALYLTQDEPQMLIDLLESVVKDRATARERAQQGLLSVQTLCSPLPSGQIVANFIFGDLR
jgi:glycosyltransferase involved in cell wall biosynthesis